MIFEIFGGAYKSERLKIESAYQPCFGTLEINASLIGIYKRWNNKIDGCPQHQRDGVGDHAIRDLVWNIESRIAS